MPKKTSRLTKFAKQTAPAEVIEVIEAEAEEKKAVIESAKKAEERLLAPMKKYLHFLDSQDEKLFLYALKNFVLHVSSQFISAEKLQFPIMPFLNEYPRIHTLIAVGCRLDDAAAFELATLTTIHTLQVDNNKIGNKGANALSKNIHFRKLSIASNLVGPEGAEAISKNIHLEFLDISCNPIHTKEAGINALINSTLKTLVYKTKHSKNGIREKIYTGFLEALKQNLNQSLTELTIDIEMTEELSELLTINKYGLSFPVCKNVIDSLNDPIKIKGVLAIVLDYCGRKFDAVEAYVLPSPTPCSLTVIDPESDEEAEEERKFRADGVEIRPAITFARHMTPTEPTVYRSEKMSSKCIPPKRRIRFPKKED